MDKIEIELLKLSLSPEEVDEPELFLERIYGVKTHEDLAVVRAMIHRRSTGTFKQTTEMFHRVYNQSLL
jgi:hypothetical protein